MKIIQLKNSEKFVLIFWLIPFLSSFLFIQENLMRSLIIISSLLLWLGLYFKSKKKILSSLLFIVLIGAFNVTFTPQIFDSCYKNGIFVNYLCPTLHSIDIYIVLGLVVSVLENYKIKKDMLINSLKFLVPLIIYSVFYLIFHNALNEIITFGRLTLLIFLLVINKEVIIDINKYINRDVIFSFIFILLIQFLIALLQFALGKDLGLQFLGESNLLSGSINSSFISLSMGEFLRGYGTFPHPNILAGFALGLSIFSIKTYEKRDRYILSLLFLSFLISILSFSRLHIILNAIVLIYYSLKNTKILMYNFFPLLFERFSSLNGESTSVIERVRLFNDGLRVLKERWLIGSGGGEFVRYLSNDIRTVSNISLFQPIHNSLLLLFIEYGIFGFITFLYYLISIFLYRKKSILERILIVAVVIIISMFDHYLISLPQGIVILMLFLL